MKYKWGELITLEYGKPVKDKARIDGKYPVFGTNGQIGTSDLEPLCNHPSFILGRKGAYRGVHYSATPFSVIDTAFYVENLHPELLDIKWAYYKFLTYDINSMDSGSAIPSTDRYEIYEIEVELPNIAEQKQVVSLLECFDEKITLNKKINNNLEQQTRALYRAWFVDFELNSGLMPSNWRISQFSSIARISTEVFAPTKNPNVQVEHYSIPAYDEKRYPILEISDGIKSNKYRLTSNSVMISKLNPDTKRIWRPYCITERPICSTEFIVYEPANPLYRDYVYSIIDSLDFSAFLCSHTTGSTNSRQRVTPSITLNYDIVLPDDETIRSFCSIVSPMYETIENNIIENQKLAETRDKLLPKLMSGELDVSDIEF